MKVFLLLANLALLLLTILATTLALPAQNIHSTQPVGVPEGYAVGRLLVNGKINGVAVNHTGTDQVSIIPPVDCTKISGTMS